jgi:glucose-1-phosphate thymidylyltransferase
MAEAGITEVLIVCGIEQCGTLIEQLGDGKEWGLNLTYKVQTEAGGIAQAISLAENFSNGDSLFVILGDNIFNMSTKFITQNFKDGAKIFLKEVNDPERFGVAECHRKFSLGCKYAQEVIVDNIEEKPKNPKSNLAVTGIYIYDNTVFDKIRTLKASERGELEVTDLNNLYIKENTMMAEIMQDDNWWTDAGTFESLEIANKIIEGN